MPLSEQFPFSTDLIHQHPGSELPSLHSRARPSAGRCVRRAPMHGRDDPDRAHTARVAKPSQSSSPLLRPTIVTVFLSEAAERCCYYGLVSMLPLFLVEGPARAPPHIAAASTAAFSSVAYATPLIGSALAATRLRMFGTIMSMSLVYLFGMCVLPFAAAIRIPAEGEAAYGGAVFFARLAVFSGLALIAFGTGGIKPNVAAFGALQVPTDGAGEGDEEEGEGKILSASHAVSAPARGGAGKETAAENASLAAFFSAFYFLINMGSIVGQAVLPVVQKIRGYGAAFAAAATVLSTAIIAFACGEYCTPTGYTHEASVVGVDDAAAPSTPANFDDDLREHNREALPHPDSLTLSVLLSVALSSRLGADWSRAELRFGVPTCRILREPVTTLGYFSLISLYWMGYASCTSLWVLQVSEMSLPWGLSAPQWTAINPISVLVALPLAERLTRGIPITTRIIMGMSMAALAVMLSVLVQLAVDVASAQGSVSAFWALPQWILISCSEVLASVTGLELAYSGAGSYAPQLKSGLQACWLLCSAAGAGGAAVTIGVLGEAGLGQAGILFALGSASVLGSVLFWRRTRNGSGLSCDESAPLVASEEEF